MDNNNSRPKARKAKASPQRPAAASSRRPGAGASSPAAPTNPPKDIRQTVTPEEIHQLIAEAAYYRAEQRGSTPGDPLQDWLEAETEVLVRVRDPAPSRKPPSA